MRYCLTLIFSICLLVSGCRQGQADTTILPVESASATSSNCPNGAVTLISWNANNFGSKKSDEVIALMARILTSRGIEYEGRPKVIADIILIQEVNSRIQSGGPQAVARLQDALGQDWDSVISNPTTGDGTERYTFLWNGKIGMNRREANLVNALTEDVDREPYGTRFIFDGKELWTYSFHAVPTAKNPIREAKLVASSGELKSRENTILAGDFNLGHTTIEDIFEGWTDHIDEKTTLKSKFDEKGNYKRYQYDHILTRGGITVCESGVIDFVSTHFTPITQLNLGEARKVSDHLPVYIRFILD